MKIGLKKARGIHARPGATVDISLVPENTVGKLPIKTVEVEEIPAAAVSTLESQLEASTAGSSDVKDIGLCSV